MSSNIGNSVDSGSAEVKKPHVDVLDGLRGLAILFVMLFHVWQLSWLNHQFTVFGFTVNLDFFPVSGFLGVELFFFISAFCLFYPYAQHLFEQKPLQTVRQFAYRRAIKILPSYWLGLLVVVVFFTPSYFSDGSGWWHVVSHLLFIHDWFVQTKNSTIGVFWSLGVEIQFYVLFPVLCWCFRKNPWVTYVLMCIEGIAFRMILKNSSVHADDFYLDHIPGFADIFANGMLAAYLLVFMRSRLKNLDRLRPYFTALAVVSFSILLCLMHWLYSVRYDSHGFEFWKADNRFFLGLTFLVLTISASFSYRLGQKVLANRVLVFLSIISYNLYIWHQFVAQKFYEWKVPGFQTADQHNDPVWQILYTLLSMGVAVVLTTGITYVYERPFLKKGVRGVFEQTLRVFRRNPAKEEN